jgi:site-specific DNA recombinase
MKAIGYIRVSTAEQAEEGVSLAAQEARIVAWCALHGHELVSIHRDVLSGSRADNRPALQACLNETCKNKAVLVVYSLSRLARSTKDAILISERLDKAGADLASLSENIDTTSAAGKMMFRMLAVLAEFERDQIRERTSTALQHKRSKGERVGNLPYGFQVAADGVHLEENAAEQETIRVIQSLRESGLSLRAIRDELQARGARNRNGNTSWRLNTLGAIVKLEAA